MISSLKSLYNNNMKITQVEQLIRKRQYLTINRHDYIRLNE